MHRHRFGENQAPLGCPQIQFANTLGCWWSLHPTGRATAYNSYLRISVVSAWRGYINHHIDTAIPTNRPHWFLIEMSVAQHRYNRKNTDIVDGIPITMKNELPRTKSVWLVTDNESWYRIGNPSTPKRISGRMFIPAHLTLSVATKDTIECKLREFSTGTCKQ